MSANDKSRRILACVTGLTPQVVTETVFALSQREVPWVPTEVHVLTTATGAERAHSMLLAEGEGQFQKLCDEYGLRDVRFDESTIHVLHNDQGQPLDDIRNQADNLAMADAILAFIAQVSADPACTIHVSLAGGRKSMGFFAGYALSLYGRPQDRLSHVLVSPGFETNPEFFFPPSQPIQLRTRSGDTVSAADACVELADIPFVRLRDRLPRELLAGGRFVDAVAAAQKFEQAAELLVDRTAQTITCAGVAIRLTALNFAVYAWLADRSLRLDSPGVRLSDFNAVGSDLRCELRTFGDRLYCNEMTTEAEQWRDRPWDDDCLDHAQWLAERRARINQAISRALGREGRRIYGIASVPLGHRQSRHQLSLAPECIHVL